MLSLLPHSTLEQQPHVHTHAKRVSQRRAPTYPSTAYTNRGGMRTQTQTCYKEKTHTGLDRASKCEHPGRCTLTERMCPHSSTLTHQMCGKLHRAPHCLVGGVSGITQNLKRDGASPCPPGSVGKAGNDRLNRSRPLVLNLWAVTLLQVQQPFQRGGMSGSL